MTADEIKREITSINRERNELKEELIRMGDMSVSRISEGKEPEREFDRLVEDFFQRYEMLGRIKTELVRRKRLKVAEERSREL